MIGSIKDLTNAASGGKVRSTVELPSTGPRPLTQRPRNTGGMDVTNQFTPGGSGQWVPAYDYDTGLGQVGQSYGEPTKTYAQMLASSGTIGGGGKYGGFNTEGALQSAIRGGAINFASLVPQNLRSAAAQRFEAMNQMLRPTSKKIEKDLFGGTIESYRQNADYKSTLKDWYKENAAPAEEYIRTAQQIEASPVSDLARQIATAKYGQSYDWATDQFKDLDTEYAAQLRNQRYLQQTGTTYDEYAAALAEQEKIRGYNTDIATRDIEEKTGLKGSFVSSVTARTPEQLKAALEGTVKYRDPSLEYGSDEVSQDTGAVVVERAKTFINDRNYQSAYDMAQTLEDEGYPDAAYVIYAMLKASGASADLKNKLALSGIVTQ